MAVNRLVYKRTLDRELKKGTSLEAAMKKATTAGERTTKGIRTLQTKKDKGLWYKTKRLFRRKGTGKGSAPRRGSFSPTTGKMK